MEILLVKVEKFPTNSKGFLKFFLIVFFVTGCFRAHEDSIFLKSEKERFEDFFKRFLFLEGAVYTLYGSKAMTEIVLNPETPDEKEALQKIALKELSKQELAAFKTSSFVYEEKYWFEESWEIWEKKLKTLPIKRFFL